MPTAPYDTLETVVTAARIRLNDAIQSAGGEILTDSAAFTIQTVNNAWRRLQKLLIKNKYSRLMGLEVELIGIPAVGVTDPGIVCSLTWSGYNPGTGIINGSFPLPSTLLRPVRVWERQNGANASFTPMEYTQNGLGNAPKQTRSYAWEWTNDSLNFPGSTVTMDMRIRFIGYLADFVPNGTTAFSSQTVPIMLALDPFAWYIAAEAAAPRGDADSADLYAKGDAAALELLTWDQSALDLRSEWTIPDIPPASGATPYDSVATMLNSVRTRMNSLASKGGDVVVANQSFTQQCVNTGWRRMQEFLLANKFSRLCGLETIVFGIPATVTSDPGIFCSLTWSGYNPGNGVINASFALPNGLIRPIRVWERVNGSASAFTPMEFTQNGLGNQPKQGRSYAWEWTGDSLNFPGSTAVMDLRIRYDGLLSDFATGSTPWYAQSIPISRALDALSWYTCIEIASARPDLGLDVDAIQGLQTKAEASCMQLVAKDQQAADMRGEQTIPDIPAATGSTAQDTAGTILNVARARLNAVSKVAGDIISALNPFTQQYFNTAWRKLQEHLANLGYAAVTDEALIVAVPTVTSTDPASQTSLSWSGFFDGTNLQSIPVLPSNLTMPLKMWERQTGLNAVFPLRANMEKILDGLPACTKLPCNRFWEWRANAIYMPGSTYSMDLRIRYCKFLADFSQSGSILWYAGTVPIARCSDALSLYVCAEVALARPDLELDPELFKTEAQGAAALIMNRDSRANQRVNQRRQSRSGRLEGGGCGGDYCD